MRAYGVKNPAQDKAARIQSLEQSPDKRYYPKNRDGVVDEWAAVAKNQYETATVVQNQKKLQKRQLMELEYGRRNYIDNIHKKRMQQAIGQEELDNERKETNNAVDRFLSEER